MSIETLVEKYRGHRTGITHLVMAHEADIIDERYAPPRHRDVPHMLHSATKSFVSTAAGMAVAEGALDLDAPMAEYLPASAPAPRDPRARSIRIRDLLTMRTGHATGSSGLLWRTLPTSWIAQYLQEPLDADPGTRFIYSSGTSHMLSVCVQRAVGSRLDDYLRPRLFEPLGFAGASWATDPEGYCSGGNGLSVRTVDLLKWGILHLQRGMWDGSRVLDESWVEAATSWQVDADHATWNGIGYGGGTPDAGGAREEGYGYQIWVRDGAYYASGMFGQLCVVVPDARVVVAVDAALERPRVRELTPDLIALARSTAQELSSGASPARRVPVTDEPRHVAERLAGVYEGPAGPFVLRLALEDARPVLVVEGSDAAGALGFTAGIGEERTDRGPMSGAQLHHSYVEADVPVSARFEALGAQSARIDVDYLSAPFVDSLHLELAEDGSLLVSRRTNVNSTVTDPVQTVLRTVPSGR